VKEDQLDQSSKTAKVLDKTELVNVTTSMREEKRKEKSLAVLIMKCPMPPH
jgi:hypothetical protein